MFANLLTVHIVSVILFLLLYVVKTVLLLMNKFESLDNLRKKTLVIEMIISVIFLLTGIYLAFNSAEVRTAEGLAGWFILKVVLVLAVIPIGIIGFKRKKKIFAILGLIILLYVYGMAETKSAKFKKSKTEPVPVATQQETPKNDIVLGKNIYDAHCKLCHGADGTLQLSGASDLSISAISKSEAIKVIMNGRKNMQPFKDKLSEEEIKAVADYIMEFRTHLADNRTHIIE